MIEEEQIQQALVEWTGAVLTPEESFAIFRSKLAAYLNQLITGNFSKLVFLLYRIDVSEKKLKLLLQQNKGTDAGLLVADLLIERQREKLAWRQKFKNTGNNDSDEERW